MNYLKAPIYGFLFALLFYPLVELCSVNGRFFAPTYFSMAGFIVTIIYATAIICFAGYALEFARKKDPVQGNEG